MAVYGWTLGWVQREVQRKPAACAPLESIYEESNPGNPHAAFCDCAQAEISLRHVGYGRAPGVMHGAKRMLRVLCSQSRIPGRVL
jgi:hypothetical protein